MGELNVATGKQSNSYSNLLSIAIKIIIASDYNIVFMNSLLFLVD